MNLEALATAARRVVGIKQTGKALQRKQAVVVFLAEDADSRLTDPIRKECEEAGVEVVSCETMQALGKACGIHAGASAAAILKA
ncbi:MAG: ribosomal L7Ae/L30e/S12e/Gadd45 family protein [Succiniclasticum sp.]|jgi:large subunit ribosomal protein L7A